MTLYNNNYYIRGKNEYIAIYMYMYVYYLYRWSFSTLEMLSMTSPKYTTFRRTMEDGWMTWHW